AFALTRPQALILLKLPTSNEGEAVGGAAGHGETAAVRADRPCFALGRRGEDHRLLPAAAVIQANASVASGARQHAVLAERQAVDDLRIAAEHQRLARDGLIPDANEPIAAARGELSVATERDGEGGGRQAVVNGEQRLLLWVIEADFAALAAAAAARDQHLAGAAEGQAGRIVVAGGQAGANLPRLRVPQADFVIEPGRGEQVAGRAVSNGGGGGAVARQRRRIAPARRIGAVALP